MPKLDITLDRWMPDLLPFAMPKGGLTICKNILPMEEGFKIMPAQIAYSSNAMTGTPLSGEEFYADDGIYYTFFGTTTGLWRIGPGNTLTDVTRTSGPYTTSGNRWYFAKYGNWIVATNFNDEVQVIKGMTAPNFEPLVTTETIKAKYVVQNHGHLLLGYVVYKGITYPNGVLISVKDKIDDLSTVPGSDIVNLEECKAAITGMTIFEFASAGYDSNIAIFHYNSISVAWWIGSPYNFKFDYNRYINIGALPGTPIIADGIGYFYDEKTFYEWTGIEVPKDVGFGVRSTILNFLDIGNYYKITAATHPRYGLVIWSVVSTVGGGAIPNYLIVFNTRNKKFSLIEDKQYCIFSMHKNEWTINQLGDFYPTIESIPYSVDSNFWADVSSSFGCIGIDLKVNIYLGNPKDWTLETGEYFTPEYEIIKADRAYPLVQKRSSDITVSFGTRMNKTDNVDYRSTIVRSNGYADLIKTGRFLRTKLTGGLMDGITGIDVEGEIIGRH